MKKFILSLAVLALISCGGGSSSSNDYYNPEPEVVEVQTTEVCNYCNGSGQIPCLNCAGGGIIPMFDSYYGIYQEVRCPVCGGYGAVTCPTCNGSKYIKRTSYQPSFKGGSSVTFVKTNYKCDKCSGCSGYHGLKHANNTYEGPCQNTDGWGHKCGHSPEHHGLRGWH